MSADLREPCPVCSSGHTYWTFSSVDGDVWYCGSCGHQWTIEISEITPHRGAMYSNFSHARGLTLEDILDPDPT